MLLCWHADVEPPGHGGDRIGRYLLSTHLTVAPPVPVQVHHLLLDLLHTVDGLQRHPAAAALLTATRVLQFLHQCTLISEPIFAFLRAPYVCLCVTLNVKYQCERWGGSCCWDGMEPQQGWCTDDKGTCQNYFLTIVICT